MKKYQIEIQETLARIITVTASNEDMAIKIVKDRYHDEEIVLNYGDFVEVEFNNLDELALKIEKSIIFKLTKSKIIKF